MVGVLALQGDFAKHIEMLKALGVKTLEVRKSSDLDKCDALIIPGGESTVMLRQMDFIGMREELVNFASQKPVFGTCAGLILMSNQIHSSKLQPLKLMNVEVERNAFGRQIESFECDLEVDLPGMGKENIPAFFIRAPKIRVVGEGVEVLACYHGEPVLIRQGKLLGASFHPELTGSNAIHKYFIGLIDE